MKKIYDNWEEFYSDQLCSAWVATAIAGQVLGAGASIYTSSKAAEAQKEAALAAGQSQVQAAQIGAQAYTDMANKAFGYIQPYTELG